MFAGFSLAVVVGVPVGLAIGASKRAWQAFNPLIQILRPVSPLAWFPIWLDIVPDAGKAAMWVIFITSLWPTVFNTAAGAAAVPPDQQAVAQVFKFGKVAYLRHVLVPNTLPSIVTGMRVSMGIAWMVIVAVEMLAGGGGSASAPTSGSSTTPSTRQHDRRHRAHRHHRLPPRPRLPAPRPAGRHRGAHP